jgi:hypothetical protein
LGKEFVMENFHYWGRNGIEQVGLRLSEEERRCREEARLNRKETPEEMIRSLQSVFCGGRYRSWVCSAYGSRL